MSLTYFIGERIALVLDSKWCEAAEKHHFLKGGMRTTLPADLIVAELHSVESAHGVWVNPDVRYSDFPESIMFIPWQFIWSIVLLRKDGETKLSGLMAARSDPGFLH